MQKVYEADDRVLIHHLKNLLEAEGIECMVKNDQIHTLAGEVPIIDIWPEVWVVDETLAGRAERIIDEHLNQPPSDGRRWTCRQCGEEHESQFTECWNCGAGRPE